MIFKEIIMGSWRGYQFSYKALFNFSNHGAFRYNARCSGEEIDAGCL
jgi:hypothetical protein